MRYLVVIDHTLGGTALTSAVREHAFEEGDIEVNVIVPATETGAAPRGEWHVPDRRCRGGRTRPHRIERFSPSGLAEDENEVCEFIFALMDDLDPRDGQEYAVARRIAEGELRLARADRFESVGLSAAGRLTEYERDSGLGQGQENQRDILIHRLREASLLLQNPGRETEASWLGILDLIYALKRVPPERRKYPEGWMNEESDSEIWKRYVLDKVVPRYWPSPMAASAAVQEAAAEVSIQALDLDGVAEERAVESALEVGGVLDRASILRSRAQRAVERDRAMYAELRRRHVGGDDEGGDS